jgi:predicted ester cyclase
MSAEHNKALILRWFDEVWNQGKESTITELFAEGGKSYGFPDPTSAISVDDFVAAHRGFNATFSDIHVTIDELIAEGDSVAVRFTAHLTHTGPGLGFAATNKRTVLTGGTIAHIRDGKIQEGWNYLDMAGFAARLQAE